MIHTETMEKLMPPPIPRASGPRNPEKPRGRFFRQVAVAYILSCGLFELAFTYALLTTLRGLADRAMEVENWGLAAELAAELQPSIHPSEHGPVLLDQYWSSLARVRRLLPNYRIFFVHKGGYQLLVDSGAPLLKPEFFPPEILEAALSDTAPDPAFYTVPYQDQSLPFSVARMNFGGTDGYLLVLLRTNDYSGAAALLLENAGARAAVITFVVVSLVAVAFGLVLFSLVTKNFYKLLVTVRAYRDGDFSQRAPATVKNEIGELSAAVNEMAEQIVSNIDELRRRDETRRELMANIAHDLRSPAAGIVALTDTLALQGATLPPEETERCYQGLTQCGESLTAMVDELFELSRLESGEIRLHPEEVSVRDLTTRAASRFRAPANRRGITARLSESGGDALVQCDVKLIGRVLDNLLGNSLKFTAAGGTITLGYLSNSDSVRLFVSDTGSGIPKEQLTKIFDRFEQLGQQRSGPDLGLGLGLAIVAHILQLHQVAIAVESEVGRGSTFSFELPRVSAPERDRSEG